MRSLHRGPQAAGIFDGPSTACPSAGRTTSTRITQDEIYIVQSGRGVLRVEGDDHPVGPGSVVSVDRGAEHNFTDIREELTVMVLFAPPETPET